MRDSSAGGIDSVAEIYKLKKKMLMGSAMMSALCSVCKETFSLAHQHDTKHLSAIWLYFLTCFFNSFLKQINKPQNTEATKY